MKTKRAFSRFCDYCGGYFIPKGKYSKICSDCFMKVVNYEQLRKIRTSFKIFIKRNIGREGEEIAFADKMIKELNIEIERLGKEIKK